MRNLDEKRIVELLQEQDVWFKVKPGTIASVCPSCGEDDKLSIRKKDGLTICYRGSCDFKTKPFYEWLMLTAGISRQEAIDKVNGYVHLAPDQQLKLNLVDPDAPAPAAAPEDQLQAIPWPPVGCYDLSLAASEDGRRYLESRGISVDLARYYGIMYNVATRRVVFPICMKGQAYGWQGRAIDPVRPGDRMRNNPGFQRARSVMFLDRLNGSPHAIIAEGPFDALKFHPCGGNVSTMGKVISSEQLKLILSFGIQKVYLALDADAAPEMRALQSKIQVPLYRIVVPESAAKRCEAAGKKADFGECTPEECAEAFRNAVSFDQMSTVLHLKW